MKTGKTFKLTSNTKQPKLLLHAGAWVLSAITTIIPREGCDLRLCTTHNPQLTAPAQTQEYFGSRGQLSASAQQPLLAHSHWEIIYLVTHRVGCSWWRRKPFQKHKDVFPNLSFTACFPMYSKLFFWDFKISCNTDFYEEAVHSIFCLCSWFAFINKAIKLMFPKLLLEVEEEIKSVPMLCQWLGRSALIPMAQICSLPLLPRGVFTHAMFFKTGALDPICSCAPSSMLHLTGLIPRYSYGESRAMTVTLNATGATANTNKTQSQQKLKAEQHPDCCLNCASTGLEVMQSWHFHHFTAVFLTGRAQWQNQI